MRRQCASPACTNYYTPSRENRAYSPCCSVACYQAYRDMVSSYPQPALGLQPVGSPTARRQVNRRHGTDRKGVTGHE